MELVIWSTQLNRHHIMDNTKIIKNMVKVYTLIKTKILILDGGHSVKNMGKELISIMILKLE